jgi:hypothetical protein
LPAGSRIAWESRDWYLNGANMPWINWACDFGCADKGVASAATNATVDGILAQAQANDVKVVRWWVFEGDAWQITRDAGGAHICIAVFARGLLNHLFTRLYFAGDPANAGDPVLLHVPAERRTTLLAHASAADTRVYRFDIVLQGIGETAFFSF